MALTKITKSGITDSAVERAKIEADAVDATKIADNAISEEHLDTTVITGLTELSETANDSDVLIIYDTSAGTLKKVLKSNVSLQLPSISSVSPTSATSGDGTGNYTFTITGSGFTGASANLINNSGTAVPFDTVTIDSDTQITGVIAKSSLPGSGEPYDVKVTGASGLTTTLTNQINIDQSPTFNTASGSLGSMIESGTFSFTVEAYDPESAGNVTFEIQSGSIPAGLTTSTTHENGVSKFIIGGTASAVGSDTTSTFTVRASDASSNTSSRQFSITVVNSGVTSFTSSGTFTVPNGLTTLDVLIVGGGGSGGSGAASHTAGGGGGAGGLIYFPGYPVTNGTITVTVGCGAPTNTAFHDAGTVGQDSVFGSPGDPGLTPTSSILTAKGGGAGSSYSNPGQTGGSGGGGGTNNTSGGTATQPTQPGNSGAYGFGNNGGTGQPYSNFGEPNGGGGGGAGGAGSNATSGTGGVGKAYTIADGTTPVYYAGGGGGGSGGSQVGGQGGGGTGGQYPREAGCAGGANKGGGGGGAAVAHCVSPEQADGGAGGKGIIIVSY